MNFAFQPLTAAELPLLHEWMRRPHVAAVWKPTPSVDELREEYLSHRDDPSSPRAYIAHLDGAPIGLIQSYVAAYSGDGWWPDERDPGVLGIDQFLADESRLSQGIGSAMVRAFVDRLLDDPATTRVQTVPRQRMRARFDPTRKPAFADCGRSKRQTARRCW